MPGTSPMPLFIASNPLGVTADNARLGVRGVGNQGVGSQARASASRPWKQVQETCHTWQLALGLWSRAPPGY